MATVVPRPNVLRTLMPPPILSRVRPTSGRPMPRPCVLVLRGATKARLSCAAATDADDPAHWHGVRGIADQGADDLLEHQHVNDYRRHRLTEVQA